MRMISGGKHMQLFEHLSAQRILGQHALYCEFDRAFGMLVEQLLQACGLEIAQITSVVVIKFIEPRIEDAPAICIDRITKSTAGPGWPEVDRGA